VASITHAPFSEITLVNGSTILARSGAYEGKYLRGRAAHRVVVDEAAFVPERTVQEAILPMLADSGGQLVLISTPFGRNAFWEAFVRGQGGDPSCRSFQFPSQQNPHISAAYIAAQRETMTDLQWRAEWLAEFLDDQSTVFKWALIERAICGELSGPVPGHRYSVGWDPAKYRDRSALIVLDVTDERPQHVVYCETLEGRDYGLQINRVAQVAATYNRADVLMDCTGQRRPAGAAGGDRHARWRGTASPTPQSRSSSTAWCWPWSRIG
jgi:phage FluMu gp28-like protein